MNAISGNPIRAASAQSDMTPDEWRGKCLNVFACNELAVIRALEVVRAAGITSKIPHLAGQRLAALQAAFDEIELPSKLGQKLAEIVSEWKVLEERRPFLAHGVMLVSHEPSGRWVALLDVRTYRANACADIRWAVLQAEAALFLDDLEAGFQAMSQQLGHFRKLPALQAAA